MPSQPLPAPLSPVDRPGDAGTIAHAVVAHLAGEARDLPAHALTERVIAAAGRLCADANTNRRRVVWTEAASTACAYLRLMLPPAPWALLGTEVALGQGRADVVWVHPVHGVLVDELKSGKTSQRGGASGEALAQARRYAAALATEHGPRAIGVRLFVAGSLSASVLVLPSGKASPLRGSAWCPRVLDGSAL